MIDLYTWKTPNGRKASIMLEETGLPYQVKPVDLGKEEQRQAEFVEISPNGKIPAMVDHDGAGGPLALFESGAILTYLAERSGRFLAASGPARYRAMAWTYWQSGGLGPMMGQLGFFSRQAERNEPAIARYASETGRLLHVLDAQLGRGEYLAGGDYSIADIATYPWVSAFLSMMKQAIPEDARELPQISRWLATVGARPAVQRGMVIPA